MRRGTQIACQLASAAVRLHDTWVPAHRIGCEVKDESMQLTSFRKLPFLSSLTFA
jgi:hypothetical protein